MSPAVTPDPYAPLRLENQLCFPLYACAREIIKLYKPALDEIDLTYTQYIAMMVLWEQGEVTAGVLGDRLRLDSGTLTPMLKKMELKGLLTRRRDEKDERSLLVALTPAGEALKDRALSIPPYIGGQVHLEPQEAGTLYTLLYKILNQSAEGEHANGPQ